MIAHEEKELTLSETHLPFSVFINTSTRGVRCHWHNHLEILYLISGDAVVSIGNEAFNVTKGDFLIINSNEYHAVSAMNNTRFLVIQFKPSLIKPEFSSLFEIKYFLPFLQKELRYQKHIKLSERNELSSFLNEILEDFNNRYNGFELNVKGNIYKIFSWLIRNGHITLPSAENLEPDELSRLSKLLEYVKNNYYEKITDESASKMAFLSYHHFCRVFKRVTGKTFIEYLNYVRLCEAEKLLISSAGNIAEIAMNVGFSSTSYFTRLFKKEKGITPVSYRKQNCSKV